MQVAHESAFIQVDSNQKIIPRVVPNGLAGFEYPIVEVTAVQRMAELEPVGTHPDHRGKGLGKAVCAEGIRRVQKYNPSCIVILGAAPSDAAAGLYASLGFEKEDVYIWKKTL